MAADDALTARLRQALADRDGVTEKRMFGGVCCMLRDHMLCGTGKCPEPEVRTQYAARAVANFGFNGALES